MSKNYTLNRSPNGNVIAVMVVWNGITFLQAGVESVLANLRTEDDLLVVDNGSTDGSYEYLIKKFPQIAILETNKNLGGAGGFNAGMKIALNCSNCNYVWLLDNDIIAENNALIPLIETFKNSNNTAAVGSQICLYNQPEIIQEIGGKLSPWLGGLKLQLAGEKRIDKNQKATKVDYLAACSLLIKVEVLRKIGMFWNFFVFYDDVEWGLRANRAGWSLWAVPASVIRHNFTGTKGKVLWREYYRRRNRAAFLALYPTRMGKGGALLIYLISLNFWVLYNRWIGNASFSEVYRRARNDLLNGNFGKRDLSDIPTFDKPSRKNYVIRQLARGMAICFAIGVAPFHWLKVMQNVKNWPKPPYP